MSHRTLLAAIVLTVGLLPAPVTAAPLNDQLIQDAKDGSLAGVQNDLANGADVNATHENGRTALMLAAEWDTYPDVASLLVAHGANVNAKDNRGMTALMYAVQSDRVHVAGVLLAPGADVNAKNNDGETALEMFESDPLLSADDDFVSLLQAAGAH